MTARSTHLVLVPGAHARCARMQALYESELRGSEQIGRAPPRGPLGQSRLSCRVACGLRH
jgi:hypothetical protein